ncbi:EAL domain-containing protein [Pseudoneobacillus sp. C159]
MKNYLHDEVFFSSIYNTHFDKNIDAFFVINNKGKFIIVNESVCRLTGFSEDELLKQSFTSIVNEEDIKDVKSTLGKIVKGKKETFNINIVTKECEKIDLIISAFPVLDEQKLIRIACFAKDSKDDNKDKLQVEILRNQFINILNSIDVCFCSFTPETTQINPISTNCEKIFGYAVENFRNKPLFLQEMIHPDDINILENINQKLLDGKSVKGEYRIINADSQIKWVRSSTIPVFNDEKELIRMDSIVIDISQQRIAEESLKFIAFHDTLTELPNRRKFFSLMKEAIELAEETKKKMAVLFIDLDHFKLINETLGHKTGDGILQIIAKRLVDCLSPTDVVSRQSGDEFTILLTEINDIIDVELAAKRLLQTITQPLHLTGHDYTLTASIGISIYPDHTLNPEDLLKQADYTMYLAKSNGKNTFQFYRKEMTKNIGRTMELAQSLLKALEKDEFSLHYQPIINVKAQEIVGLEALLRWNHTKIGNISPVEFIPIAENLGLIIPIGKWIIRTACTHGKQMHDKGFTSMYISVNVSAKQFEEKHFVNDLLNILNETGFNPNYLKIEITESTVMKDLEDLTIKLRLLEELGIDVLLDDFGTGYSSLSYLKRLPIRKLKIDRSFIQDIDVDINQESIIRTIVTMAKSLRIGVIAEGVELESQMSFLEGIECFDLQGYLFSKPVPYEVINELLQKWNWHNSKNQYEMQLGEP